MIYNMEIKQHKSGNTNLKSVIWKTEASSLSEAKEFFVKLKDLDEKSFDRIFIVTESDDKKLNKEL